MICFLADFLGFCLGFSGFSSDNKGKKNIRKMEKSRNFGFPERNKNGRKPYQCACTSGDLNYCVSVWLSTKKYRLYSLNWTLSIFMLFIFLNVCWDFTSSGFSFRLYQFTFTNLAGLLLFKFHTYSFVALWV